MDHRQPKVGPPTTLPHHHHYHWHSARPGRRCISSGPRQTAVSCSLVAVRVSCTSDQFLSVTSQKEREKKNSYFYFQRCTLPFFCLPFILRQLSSSASNPSAARLLPAVFRSSSVSRTSSPLVFDIVSRGSHTDTGLATSSRVVPRAVQRAVACRQEEDNYVPVISGSVPL